MIVFLIPTYNEEQNLTKLHENLNKVLSHIPKYFVFVDDCSKDNTVGLIKELFTQGNVEVISKESNAGPGDSFNLGFEYILEKFKDKDCAIVTVEADNTSDLEILPEMYSMHKHGYNLVLASVYAQGGGFSKTGFFRKIISFIANMILRIVYDIKVLTLSSFYRIYHPNLLRLIKDKYGVIIAEKGFIAMLEILLKSISVNAKVIEIPMILKSDNRLGKSKMKVFKTSLSYLRFLLYFKKN